jgi:crossover junction endodeoxyribonuclease RuvC
LTAMLGVDPGVNGAIALLDDLGSVVEVRDMPTLAAEGVKGRRIVDGPALLGLLSALRTRAGRAYPCEAVLEKVQSQPRDGHVGAFSFGRSFGTIETALAACAIPFRTVRPNVWKARLGVLADKDHARHIASQLLPSGAAFWPLKKHDGRAEAALLAYYGTKT